ncbi:MAG: DNA gyrase subunit A, partial [Anaerolineales bacterium]|nr:DNA gyrase subunit A [Anaerolineales bacterium]MDW8446651.1 DNA gyrase subunit A [Anaerolineales bacterium]
YDQIEEVEIDELLRLMPGPDFPTGGVIVGSEGIRQAYSTGRGRLVLRGKAHIEENGPNRYRIVITEIPYQLNKATLIERIAELVREGKLEDISDLRDESDRRGMSIVIELKRGAQPQKILNQLYKYTPLQSTFGVQMLALVDGEPRLLTLKRALQVFIEHRRTVITRRSQFELDKARARAHVLEGLLIALAHLDEVIQTIRQAPDADKAKERLIKRFKLSEVQAQAILDLQLRRLAALERKKIEEEQRQTLNLIAYLEDLLANPSNILHVIREELDELARKYADQRRTHIAPEASEDFAEQDLIPDEAVLISLTERGYIKRTAVKAFRPQGRGGRGVAGHLTKEEDEVLVILPARTLDTLLFFSNRGKVYSEKVYQIPDSERQARGIPLVNVIGLGAGETITAVVAVPHFEAAQFLCLATRKGKVKRMPLAEFANVRPSGILAITLEEEDELGWARLTRGDNELILVTEQGQAVRFSEQEVRPQGRTAGGVAGIKLIAGDSVASMEVVEAEGELFVITAWGYGKRTPLSEYPSTSRAVKGVRTVAQSSLEKVGGIAAARVVRPEDDLTIISANGVVLRTKVSAVPALGRAARGNVVIKLQNGDRVVSVARLAAADLKAS